ncbi:TrmB family transcriptional regulator [Candidatus Lokiarchaeum ossiferum]|uniref:TrmB family transcriptional regulator n=1 Tax=Candidatus Lokiarchaeum ossiferum TaxID=2951803 RepID=UPI00352C9A73
MKLGKNIKIDSDVRGALKNLGFTDYFTNIYIALLDSGEMNAHELSKLTSVPYSRIYEVLNDMVKRRIITKLEGRPSTFIGNDPSEVFGNIKKTQETEFQQNMDCSLPFLKQLFGEKHPAKKEQLTIYEGNRASTDHFRNVLNGTNRSIKAFIKNMNEIFPIIKMNLDFLRAKGIETHLIIEERFRERSFISILKKYGTIKFYPNIEQGVLISDDNVGIQLIKGNFNIAKPKELEYSIFSSNSTSYVTFLTELFSRMWEKAIE